MNDRILLILKTQNLTSSQFADEIGVQRSNISHILSGRNNPSLEFVTKIIKRFPDLSLEWLIFGKGSMYKERRIIDEKSKTSNQKEHVKQIDLFSEIEDVEQDFDKSELLEDKIITTTDSKVENYSIHNELSSTSIKGNNEKENNLHGVEHKHSSKIENTIQEKDYEKEIIKKKIEKIVIFYEDRTFREYFAE